MTAAGETLTARQRVRTFSAWLSAAPVWRVLVAFVVTQWLVVLLVAHTVRHTAWIFYQGGDQLWYYTSAWLLGHGHFTDTSVGYLWPSVLAPGAAIAGPNVLSLLPLIILFNVVVLMPVAMLALYGIAARIGGRLFGYWVLALWILVPLLGIKYTDAGYHQRYTELTLPTGFGLTGTADFPMMVSSIVAAYFCVRVVFDDRPQLLHALAGGVTGGIAVAIKPSAGLFIVGPALAFAAARRFREAGVFVAGMVPALITLSFWKYRGYGHLPIFGAQQHAGHVVAAAAPVLALGVHKYIHLNWSHFLTQLDGLREHFWSVRLIEWLVIGGAIGLARRSLRALLLIGGWFAAYVVFKGTFVEANVSDASLFRLMIPSAPAFVLLLASLPLLFPGVPQRLRPEPAGKPRLSLRRRQAAIVAAVVVTSVFPFAAIAAASPIKGPVPGATFIGVRGEPPIPNLIDIGLKATVHDGAVSLSWKSQHGIGGPVFYHVYRDRPTTNVYLCATGGAPAPRCEILLSDVGATHATHFVDRPRYRGPWVYRVGPSANWLDNTAYGDVYVMSSPIMVRVP
jgi:hypothetical protein